MRSDWWGSKSWCWKQANTFSNFVFCQQRGLEASRCREAWCFLFSSIFFCKPCRIVAMDCLGFINIIVVSTVLITGSTWCKAGVLGNSRYSGWMLQTSFLAGWFCNLSAKTIYSVWYIYTWNLTEHFFSVRRENLLQRARDTGQTLLISQAVSLSDELDEFAGNSSLTRNSYC